MNIADQITQLITPRSDYQIGYANVAGILPNEFRDYKYAISFVRKLESHIVDEVSNGPTRPYFEQYHIVNNELQENIGRVSSFLTKTGIKNVAISPTTHDDELPEDYYQKMRLPISHKMIATRAGIGWIGKTDLLVSIKYGPRVRLASILLEDKIGETGTPITESRCGECTICVTNCPAQAANGKRWDIKTDRDLYYDPFKCRKMCRELSESKISEEISLCGICVSVCPRGK